MAAMDKEKVTLTLPKYILDAVREKASPRGHSKFIADAIQFYLDAQQKAALEASLIAGYQANAARDKAIASEWEAVEVEAWAAIGEPEPAE